MEADINNCGNYADTEDMACYTLWRKINRNSQKGADNVSELYL